MAVIAAGDFFQLQQFVEGQRMADLRWGTASAKQVVLRFSSRSAIANSRKFCVAIRNVAPTFSIVYNLTTSSTVGAWIEHTLVIPGCTTGTWTSDNTPGLSVIFSISVGTTFQTATTGAWLSGNFLGTSLIGSYPTSNQGIYIAEVGLYADPNNTGLAPPYEIPPVSIAMRDSLRYWAKCYGAVGIGYTVAGQTPVRASYPNQAVMRVAPSATLAGTLTSWDQATNPTVNGLNTVYSNTYYNEFTFSSTAVQNLGRAATILGGSAANYVAMNARM